MVLVRDGPGYSDLIFGCDLGHTRSQNGPQPYLSKRQILVSTGGRSVAGLVGFGGLGEGAIIRIVFLFGKRQHFAEDHRDVLRLEFPSGLGDIARRINDLDLLLFGKPPGCPRRIETDELAEARPTSDEHVPIGAGLTFRVSAPRF